MTTKSLAPHGRLQFTDSSGAPLSGGKVYFYEAGSSTPKNTYTDYSGITPNANPITLNVMGLTPDGVWFTPGSPYKIEVKDALGSTVYTEDQVTGINDAIAMLQQDGFTASGTGSVTRTPLAKMREAVSVLDFIPVALHASIANNTNVTDLKTYLDYAFAQTGKMVRLPTGTYLTSNLTKPVCSGILGDGDNVSILKATSGATLLLPVGSACKVLRQLRLEGNATANAIGLHIGDDVLDSGAFDIDHVRVKNFTGTTAIGAKLSFALKSLINMLTVEGNTRNFVIDGNDSLPTTVTINNLVSASGPGKAVEIYTGVDIVINDLKVDSSTGVSLTVAPAAGKTVKRLIINHPRFENTDVVAGDFDCVFDGSAAAASLEVTIRDVEAAYSARKTMQFTGAGCNFLIDNPSVPVATGMITTASAAFGKMTNYRLGAYTTVVDDPVRPLFPLLGIECSDAPWQAWVPTFSSDVGNAATTFTGPGTVTVTKARWRLTGKTLEAELEFSATLNAVTPASLRATMPGSLAALNVSSWGACAVKDGTWDIGWVRGHTSGYFDMVKKQFGGALGSGAGTGAAFKITVEIA